MSKSSELASDIRGSMSPELLSSIAVKFGASSPLTDPTTEEEAIIAIGQANVNFNNAVLVPLSGVPIIELILKNAQLNEAVIGLLLASVEEPAIASNRIQMIVPEEGGSYMGAVTEVTCTVEGAASVSVSAGGDTFDLENSDGDTWTSLWAFPIGEHSLTVTAKYETGETESLDVAFRVDFWTTVPDDGDTVVTGNLSVEVHADEGTFQMITVSTGSGDAIELVFDVLKGFYGSTVPILTETHELAFEAVMAESEEIVRKIVEVVVE